MAFPFLSACDVHADSLGRLERDGARPRRGGVGLGGGGGVSVFEKWKVKWGLTQLGVEIKIKHIDGGVQG